MLAPNLAQIPPFIITGEDNEDGRGQVAGAATPINTRCSMVASAGIIRGRRIQRSSWGAASRCFAPN